MSRFERNIGEFTRQPKKLAVKLLLAVTALMFIPVPRAAAQMDSWRRTANGWERSESWNYLVTAPVGKLRPLTVDTLVQRTWPATFAAVELSLVLLILNLGCANEPCETEESAESQLID